MKIKKSLLFMLLAVIFCLPSVAFADGFCIYEWSAGGTAMGGAYMFAEDDPSLLAYNPAGITRLKGDWIGGGLSYINPRGDALFHSGGGSSNWHNAEAPGYVPNLYYVHQQNDRLWWGIGMFTRFGNSTEYPSDFPGKYNSYYAKISSFTIQPTIAYKLTDKLSVAAGADIMYIGLDLKGKKDLSALHLPSDTDCEIDGDNIAVGWNLGFNYQITDKTGIAALYRSKIKHKMDADTKLSVPALNSGAHGEVTLPDSFTVGLGHKFNDRTRMEIGATWTGWSTYDQLLMKFDKPIGQYLPQTRDIKDWKNVWRYQIGIEHKMNEKWSILGGYSYDNCPIPDSTMDFMVPTGDRQTALIGFKYRNKNTELAFTWGFMWIGDRVVPGAKYSTTAGDYCDVKSNTAHILSIGYTVHLK